MSKTVWCAAVALLSGLALRADTFTFSYTSTIGGPVSASGTITATEVVDAGTLQAFQVTGITGTRNSETIIPPDDGGILYFGPNVTGSLSFTLSGSGNTDTVTFLNGVYAECGGDHCSSYASAGDFTISRSLAEPATLGLFLTMGLGVFLLARRFPSTRQI